MSLGDELARLRHHGGLVLGTEVDGVAQADDVHARIAHGEHGVEIGQLRGIGILLAGLHQVGLGVHLNEVVDLGIVGRILGDEATLPCEHAADALAADF